MLSESDFKMKKIILIYTHLGDKLQFKNDNLIVKDSEDKIKMQISCYKIFAIFIVGGISLTTGIISRSKKFGFSICLFNAYFKLYATINYALEGNTLLREKQYLNKNNLDIAKAIIINKIEVQRDTIKKIRDKNSKEGIEIIKTNLEKLIKNENTDLSTIMGIEGICAKVYFNRIFKEFNWKGRQPRVKKDEINLLLDIGYTVLFNYLEAILNIYGFDIYKGNLHQEFYKRKSLVCDIIEPFRPIVDYKIRKLNNLGQAKYEYIKNNEQYQIDWKDSSKYITEILQEISLYKSNIFRFVQQYYRWIMKNKDIKEFPKVVLNDNS